MRDLTRLFKANYNAFPGGIYLDIHAVVCTLLQRGATHGLEM